MELIDRGKLPRHGKRGGLVQWHDIEKVPTVEAIPIEWINHYMDTELTKGSLFYSCMREFMRDWKGEQSAKDK